MQNIIQKSYNNNVSNINRLKFIQMLIYEFPGESRNGLYGNSTNKRDLYERGHVATCSRGQAIALTVFIFSAIFFSSLAVAFIRPFSVEETIRSASYLDHCNDDGTSLHSGIHAHKKVK